MAITRTYRVEIPQYKRVYNDPNFPKSFTTERLPPKIAEVELTIDDAMLASYLGVRAAGSKRRQSAYMDGMVKARIIKEPS